MAKKDKKVIKVKTATVGKSFDTKKVDSDIEFLKAKLLKGKKEESLSDIGANILKKNKEIKPVEDDGLSDMARMILANKNKKDETVEDLKIEPEVEEIIEEAEEIIEEIEDEILEDTIEEVEDELEEVEELIEEVEDEILEDEIDELEEELEELEELINEVEDELEELEDELEEVSVVSEVEVKEDVSDITETETEETIKEEIIIEVEPETIEEEVEEITIEGKVIDIEKYNKVEAIEDEIQIYNYSDSGVHIRIFSNLENNTSFRLYIPKFIPNSQFYISETSSEFVLYHKKNILFDYHTYSGNIDFADIGMLFQGKLYPYQELNFVKM
jgi:vacuolar-type H+-ATPase subunit I/STV1